MDAITHEAVETVDVTAHVASAGPLDDSPVVAA